MISVETTKRVPLGKLKRYPKNPRKGDVATIVESLKAHGQYRALVVSSRTNEVLAGNHTFLALQELGADEALVHFVDVDDDQAKRIVLVDNRSNDIASYDDAALLALLESLPTVVGTGYSDAELRRLVQFVAGPGQDTEPGEPPAEPKTKPGDLWLLGEHRLLCGDATKGEDVARLMGGALAQMVFTDPPYGVDYEGGRNPETNVPRERLKGDGHGTSIYAEAVPVIAAAMDKKAPLYLWFAGTRGAAAYGAVEAAGFTVRALIVWHKLNAHYGAFMAQYMPKLEPLLYCVRPGARWHGPTNEVTVWEHDQPANNDLHPTQKPIALAERAVTNSSLASAVVLDPFAGSGSTLIACENLGRRAYLCEIDPGYCDVIVDRFERHTGQTAIFDG